MLPEFGKDETPNAAADIKDGVEIGEVTLERKRPAHETPDFFDGVHLGRTASLRL